KPAAKPGPKPGPKPAEEPAAEKPKPAAPKPAPKPGPKPGPKPAAPRPGNNPFQAKEDTTTPRPGPRGGARVQVTTPSPPSRVCVKNVAEAHSLPDVVDQNQGLVKVVQNQVRNLVVQNHSSLANPAHAQHRR